MCLYSWTFFNFRTCPVIGNVFCFSFLHASWCLSALAKPTCSALLVSLTYQSTNFLLSPQPLTCSHLIFQTSWLSTFFQVTSPAHQNFLFCLRTPDTVHISSCPFCSHITNFTHWLWSTNRQQFFFPKKVSYYSIANILFLVFVFWKWDIFNYCLGSISALFHTIFFFPAHTLLTKKKKKKSNSFKCKT